jgi:hypothetical protein
MKLSAPFGVRTRLNEQCRVRRSHSSGSCGVPSVWGQEFREALRRVLLRWLFMLLQAQHPAQDALYLHWWVTLTDTWVCWCSSNGLDLYSGSVVFESRLGYRLSLQKFFTVSTPPGKCRGSTSIKRQKLPSNSFPIPPIIITFEAI